MHQFFFNFVHEMGTGPPLLLPSDKISQYTSINCDPYPVESIWGFTLVDSHRALNVSYCMCSVFVNKIEYLYRHSLSQFRDW